MRVRIFLRQSLFTLPGSESHVPSATAVVEGRLVEQDTLGLRVHVDGYADEKGRKLEGEPRQLLIPPAKIDHVLYLT